MIETKRRYRLCPFSSGSHKADGHLSLQSCSGKEWDGVLRHETSPTLFFLGIYPYLKGYENVPH